MTRDILRRACGLGLALAMFPLTGAAVEIEPSVELAEVYSSNVDLAPDGTEQSDWGTGVIPSVTVTYKGPGLELDLDYAMEAWFYADDSDRNAVYNQLGSSALLDLVGKDLQLDAGVLVDQVNVDPERPQTNSNFYTTSNRSDYIGWYAGPRWRRNVLGSSEIDGVATAGRIDFDDDSIQDIDVISGRFSVHTDPKVERTLSYSLDYEYDRLDYDLSGEALVQTAYLRLAYNVNDALRVFGLAGFDNEIADAADTSFSEARWEVGVDTAMGAHSLQASIGHRYFGTTYSLSWDLVLPAASYRVSYSEQPSTSDLVTIREISTGGTQEDQSPPPDSELGRPGDPTRFVYKRGDAVGTWTWPRSELSFGLFWEKRDDQVRLVADSSSGTSVNDEESYGAEVEFRWELGARSIASLGASWIDRQYNDFMDPSCDPGSVVTCNVLSPDDDQTALSAGIDYRIGIRTSVSLAVGYQERDGGPGDSYDEYSAAVRLERTF